MKWVSLFSILIVALAVADETEDVELPLADNCNVETCQLPDCRCSSTEIPGGLAPRDTPQFVTVTFSEGVNFETVDIYRDLLNGRQNSNGCKAGATLFTYHQDTNYKYVNEFYNNGFEIGLFSMTHYPEETYWAEATPETMMREFADQRTLVAHFANIPYDEIKGIRTPYLQGTGNASSQVLNEVGLTYDASWPTNTFLDPGLWPYTLDYASIQDCVNAPCPTASFPGTWVLPIVSWLDLDDKPCAMPRLCANPANMYNVEAYFQFILKNFERNYLGNRAPFALHLNAYHLDTYHMVWFAVRRFLNLINELPDVFMVNSAEVIDWVKNPIPINEYRNKPCRTFTPTTCPSNYCEVIADHNQRDYEMEICNVCPRVYPWYGNPLGQ